MFLIHLPLLIGHLYLSGMWLNLVPTIDQKDMSSKGIGLRAQNMLTLLGAVVNMYFGGGGIWSLNKHTNLHFDNEQEIHMSSQNYEKSGYDLDLDLLTTSC